MSKISQDPGIDKIAEAKDQLKCISLFLDQTKKAINNGLSFADNFEGKINSITFTSTNTNTALNHGLGKVPSGYLILTRSANMVVYDGSAASTASVIYLRASAAGTCNVLVF